MNKIMNKIKPTALVIVSTLCLGLTPLLLTTPTMAVDGGGAAGQIQQGFEAAGGTGDENLVGIVQTVINTMLFIVGMLAVIMIIFAGIRYVTAHGDKGQVESAKNTIIYSIVGLIVSIVAYALVNWIISLF